MVLATTWLLLQQAYKKEQAHCQAKHWKVHGTILHDQDSITPAIKKAIEDKRAIDPIRHIKPQDNKSFTFTVQEAIEDERVRNQILHTKDKDPPIFAVQEAIEDKRMSAHILHTKDKDPITFAV